jgi:hypothetical protein
MFGTLKRHRGFTFTLMRGKEKVLGEIGLMFIGNNLSRCISVIGAVKLISALRKHFLHCFLRNFRFIVSPFKQYKINVDLQIDLVFKKIMACIVLC